MLIYRTTEKYRILCNGVFEEEIYSDFCKLSTPSGFLFWPDNRKRLNVFSVLMVFLQYQRRELRSNLIRYVMCFYVHLIAITALEGPASGIIEVSE